MIRTGNMLKDENNLEIIMKYINMAEKRQEEIREIQRKGGTG